MNRLFLTVALLLLFACWTADQARAQAGACPFMGAGLFCGDIKNPPQMLPDKQVKKIVNKLVRDTNKLSKSLERAQSIGSRNSKWVTVGKAGKKIKKRVKRVNRAIKRNKTLRSEFNRIKRSMTRDEFLEVIDAHIQTLEALLPSYISCVAEVENGTICECKASEVSASFEFRTGSYGECACYNEVFIRWDDQLSVNASSVTAVYDWTGGGQLERTETKASPFDNGYSLNDGEVLLSVPEGNNWIRILGSYGVDFNFDRCSPDCTTSMASIMSFLQDARVRINC